MYELKRISATSCARVTSFIFAVLYVIFGLISLVTGGTAIGSGIVSLLVGFVIFAIFGGVFGLLVAGFYNFGAKKWGGMHVDFELIDEDDDTQSKGHDTHADAQPSSDTPQY